MSWRPFLDADAAVLLSMYSHFSGDAADACKARETVVMMSGSDAKLR
jgi:hypothetical protein